MWEDGFLGKPSAVKVIQAHLSASDPGGNLASLEALAAQLQRQRELDSTGLPFGFDWDAIQSTYLKSAYQIYNYGEG